VLLSDSNAISADALGLSRRGRPADPPSSGDLTLKAAEIQEITRALRAEGGRVERAAQRLGVPRSSLYQKIRKYGIAIPRA
jgi:transcriptional regulator of acetoin/glycerol metabolism